MPSARWTQLIDTIYALEAPETDWVGAVAEAARAAFGEGEGVAAYSWSMHPTPSVGLIRGDHDIAKLPMTVHDEMPAELVRAAYGVTPRALPVSWAWATPRGPMLPPRFASNLKALDLVDGYAVLCPVGAQGLAIGLGMPRRRRTPTASQPMEQRNQRWGGVARHVCVALELRAASRSAVGAIDEPQSVWRDHAAFDALLDGRWSVVKVERQARSTRYLVVENHDELRRPRPAEREVLERALAGQPLKRIALDLGLAESSVATSLSRSLSRLGVASVAELQQLKASLHQRK